MTVIFGRTTQNTQGPPLMDRQLEEIIQAGPVGAIESTKSFQQKALSFCRSRIGISILASVVFFLVLLFMQPTYIFKKNEDNQRSLVQINYTVLVALSILGGLCVFFVPSLIIRA